MKQRQQLRQQQQQQQRGLPHPRVGLRSGGVGLYPRTSSPLGVSRELHTAGQQQGVPQGTAGAGSRVVLFKRGGQQDDDPSGSQLNVDELRQDLDLVLRRV